MYLVNNLQGFAEGKLLRHRGVMRAGLVTIVQVGLQGVISRYLKELLDLRFNGRNRLHMLQICAQSLQLKGGPDEKLSHTRRVLRKLAEHVCARLVCLACCLNTVAAFPENNLPLCQY